MPATTSDPGLGAKRHRLRLGPVARWLIGIALGGLALYAVSGQRGELAGVSGELSRLNPWYVALAGVAEFVSFVSFARMQGRLILAGGFYVPAGRLLGITAAASAMASSIPAGPVVATVYAYRQYRRFGADESIAGWALVATLLTSAMGLTLVAGAGVMLAEPQGAALDLVDVTVVVLLVVALATAVFTRRRFVLTVAIWAIRMTKRVVGFPKIDADILVANIAGHLNQVSLTRRDFVPALLFSLSNWIFDCGCLAFAYVAVGAGIPWRGLLLAYGAGQLAANLPVTPGGLGIVEGSLTVALVAYGGIQTSTVAAVILYRIISFWIFLPCGWLAWAGLALKDRRADRQTALDASTGTSESAVLGEKAPGSAIEAGA